MSRHPAIAAEQVVLAATALATARQTGVLAQLQDEGGTPSGIADELDLDERLLSPMLDALVALDIVSTGQDGRCRVDASVTAGLRAAERYQALPDVLRGTAETSSVHRRAGAADVYPDLVGMLGSAFADAAEEVADLLAAPGIRVLDVGAGAAPWSLAIARREPTVDVVALDLPEVVGATREAVTTAGLHDRLDVVPGDVFDGALDDDLGGPFDLVLVANLCHLFDPAHVGRLLADVGGQLAPGGRLAVVDVLPDGAREHPGLALYALGLALRTSTGGLHRLADYKRWLRATGLGPPALHRTRDGMAVLVASSPGQERPRARPDYP